MMKNLYLVCYDIMDGKRLGSIYKLMKGFGEHVQYSVFKCRLAPKERVMLKIALLEVINQREDKVMIINLGTANETSEERIEMLGLHEKLGNDSATVV